MDPHAAALAGLDGRERAWMTFLLETAPPFEHEDFDPDLLRENVAYAALVRDEVPTGMQVPEEVFREYVLPSVHLDERRDAWRPLFFRAFAEPARRAASIQDAVQYLNRHAFETFGIAYHPTKRPHDNMSPFESMAWRYASCTGLSILLADACRAVGIPARLVGTPAWTDGSGNHTWVEVWDHGTWHFLGASEPGPYDRCWFNDAARKAAGPGGRGIFAARRSPSGLHFPLAWNPTEAGVPAEDVSARYREIPPTPARCTRIVIEPRRYVAPRVERPIDLTGGLDDPQWSDVPWTGDFVDIEGHRKPPPRFRTRAKMCWDETYFYVAAELEDPHVHGSLTEKNAIIFNDPDFEIFIDPDGDNHHYYEFEINALGTIWELYLERPYRDGGPIHRGHNLAGVRSAVRVHGTCNDPRDVDEGWTVEVAIPWASLALFAREVPCPPQDGDVWRMNFSRVHWLLDVLGDRYEKVPREAHPEDNWVWTPQDAIDMHRPEKWGYVSFSAAAPGAQPSDLPADPTAPAREELMQVYEQQQLRPHPQSDPAKFLLPGVRDERLGPLRVHVDGATWQAEVPITTDDGIHVIRVDHEGRLQVDPPAG